MVVDVVEWKEGGVWREKNVVLLFTSIFKGKEAVLAVNAADVRKRGGSLAWIGEKTK